MNPAHDDLTVLLRRSAEGDAAATEAVLDIVAGDLQRMARARLRHERPDHTLQTTALVNEAWMRLLPRAEHDWSNRAVFFAAAARAMRQVLVDHARARASLKRGGDRQRQPFEVVIDSLGSDPLDAAAVLDLHEALEVLSRIQPRAARAVELRFFAGLTVEETARALGVARGTAELDFRAARAWLSQRLEEGAGRGS